jgi:hypothetical protein
VKIDAAAGKGDCISVLKILQSGAFFQHSGANGTRSLNREIAGRVGACHIQRMAEAFFVRVEAARSASTGGRTFEIWIVATDDPDEAKRAVEAMVSPGSNIEVIHDRPSDETIKRLALAPGQAWLL